MYYYDDPREGGKRLWSAAERRSGDNDVTVPEDTKGDFSEVPSNDFDERQR